MARYPGCSLSEYWSGGKETSMHQSAKSCGCDPGAGWVCQCHCAKDAEQLQAVPEVAATTCSCDPGAGWACIRHCEEDAARLRAARDEVEMPDEALFARPTTQELERKTYPVATGVLDYFPLAIREVAHVSYIGGEQHHPGQPVHWDRSKSTDEADALMRHFLERGTLDTDGVRHTAKVAWRSLALLEKELEAERDT